MSEFEIGQTRPKKRFPIEQAESVANLLGEWLEPQAQVLVLVGSIRRRRPFVADIEFVILPKDLETFDRIVTSDPAFESLGFRAGAKRRRYTGFYQEFKIELYLAHDPDELGAMVLAYTGDYLFNIVMRTRAKQMGYKLDQYGIWKGKKAEFQSPDEKEFFDFIGMDYHSPEERSFARRSELRKIVRGLFKRRLSPENREKVEKAAELLKTRSPLPPDLEAEIGLLAGRRRGSELGFLPVPEEEVQDAREIVQRLYDQEVGRNGQVLLLSLNLAYGVAQVIAEIREEGNSVVYLLVELTDLPEEIQQVADIDPEGFIETVVREAEEGKIRFIWDGPYRPMVE